MSERSRILLPIVRIITIVLVFVIGLAAVPMVVVMREVEAQEQDVYLRTPDKVMDALAAPNRAEACAALRDETMAAMLGKKFPLAGLRLAPSSQAALDLTEEIALVWVGRNCPYSTQMLTGLKRSSWRLDGFPVVVLVSAAGHEYGSFEVDAPVVDADYPFGGPLGAIRSTPAVFYLDGDRRLVGYRFGTQDEARWLQGGPHDDRVQ